MRQTIKEIQVNIGYRWYLGYGFDEENIFVYGTHIKANPNNKKNFKF